MALPSIILDGTMPYGSRTITIGGVAYKVNNLTVTPAWVEAEDNDTDGTPNRKRWTRQRSVFQGEFQLATGSTARPAPGTTFSGTFDTQAGSQTFVVTLAPYEESNDPGAIRVANVTAEEVINSVSTVA